jgi:large subunit ribosomal protein L24
VRLALGPLSRQAKPPNPTKFSGKRGFPCGGLDLPGGVFDTLAPLVGPEEKMQKIRRGDLVQVVAGTDRGKQGRVIGVDLESARVRVEKVRVQKRHLKPGRAGAQQGGIIEDEGYIALSNVMLVNPADNKPCRVRVEGRGDERVRVFARGGEAVPEPVSS